jgi:hypothetical protein
MLFAGTMDDIKRLAAVCHADTGRGDLDAVAGVDLDGSRGWPTPCWQKRSKQLPMAARPARATADPVGAQQAENASIRARCIEAVEP